jgi:protocatechuate 3,4-dioxygenase beta subunit
MTSDFEIAAGEQVSLTTYIDSSAGTPSAASLLDGVLTYDSGSIATLKPTTVTLVSGTIYKVDWKGTLANDAIILAGQDIELKIVNNQPGLNFRVLYDSATYSSKLDLPTKSYIDVTDVEVYNNSYANGGGNLINAAGANGSTFYVRVRVEDPFGDYDITGLNLSIKDPNNNLTNIPSNQLNVVDTAGDGVKIYEYAWTPPTSTLGGYQINATAQEGLETGLAAVSDTGSTTFNLNSVTVPNVIIGDATAVEGNKLVFDVGLSLAGGSDVVLDLTTIDNSAIGITDYEDRNFEYSLDGGTVWITAGGSNGTQVTIPAGSTGIKVRLDSNQDPNYEPNETFTLAVNSVIAGAVGNTSDTGLGTITNDDALPAISISDVTLLEGNILGKEKQYTFTVSLSNPSGLPVTVNYATANDTATLANNDYISGNGTVTFEPGETTKSITVNDVGDITAEPNETFFVNLTSPTNATISDTQGVGTIVNDDTVAIFSIDDVTKLEGNSSTTIYTFTVTRSGFTTFPASVQYQTANGTATSGSDYAAITTGTLNFGAGVTTQTITVNVTGDTPPEIDETFFVNLSNPLGALVALGPLLPSGGAISDGQGIGTILNDDASGNITGSVKSDTNNDNTGDQFLAGVTIELLDAAGNSIDSNPNAPGVQKTTTTTAADGTYSFNNLAPVNYLVKQTNLDDYQDVSDKDGGADLNSIAVTVTKDETNSGNDFVDEKLGAIAGTVLKDTNNDNIGDSPVGGVSLELLDSSGNPIDSNSSLAGVQPTTTTTNAGGSYSFGNLPPGTYQVRETNLANYQDVSDADAGNPNLINNINVTAGNTTSGRDFVDEQLGSITGSVTADTDNNNSGDANLAGVTLELLDSAGNPVLNASNNPITTTTLANGSYSFTGVAPGTYQVRQTNLAGYQNVSDTQGANDNIINLTVTAGATASGNNFVDEQLGSITGSVTADTDNNNSGDANLAGVTLELLDSAGNPVLNASNNPITTTTLANGSYSFTGVAPGSYQIRQTNLAGYQNVSDTQGANDNIINLTVTAGATASGNNFVDEQLGSITGQVQSDNDNNGTADTPIAEVSIELLDASGNPIDSNSSLAGVQPTTTTTAADGSYSFTGITPGNYQIRETNKTGFGDVSDVDGGNLNNIAVNLNSGNSTGNNFVDEPLRSITGTVQSDNDNNNTGDTSLGGVTIELLDAAGNPIDSDPNTLGVQTTTTTTAADGSYSFAGITPGNYQVKLTNPTGYTNVTPTTVAVNLNSGSGTANFVEEPLRSVTGTVQSDNDNNGTADTPISGVSIELLDVSGNPIDSNSSLAGVQPTTTTTAADGSYSFTGITPGDYQVRETNKTGFGDVSDSDGGNLNNIAVNLNSGNSTGNNFIDEPLGSITGSVSADTDNNNSGDAPLAGVTLQLLDSAGNPVVDGSNNPITVTTNATGNYTFTGVAPGNYQIRQVNQSDYINVSDTDGANDNIININLSAGQNVTGGNFVDEPLRTISGQVQSDTNNDNTGDSPLLGVTLELLDSNGDSIDSNSSLGGVQPTTITTAADGSYSFTGITPGDYQVRETNPSGYIDVSDVDDGNLNNIAVNLNNGNSTGRNFVDEQPGSITGSVKADTDNDGSGDANLAGVTLELLDSNGLAVKDSSNNPITTTTLANGSYSFTGIAPGDYKVRQTNLPGYGDVSDTDGTNDSIINLAVNAGTASSGNNFVDEYDIVPGTGGSEPLTGNTGNQMFIGGAGQDTLTGNGGDDLFHFNRTSDGIDIITDFDATNGDKLDFSDIVDGELSTITFADNAFDDGYVKAVTFGTYGVMIQVDVDRNDTLDNKDVVLLAGVSVGDIDASDFIF